jgi:hypothetical protein
MAFENASIALASRDHARLRYVNVRDREQLRSLSRTRAIARGQPALFLHAIANGFAFAPGNGDSSLHSPMSATNREFLRLKVSLNPWIRYARKRPTTDMAHKANLGRDIRLANCCSSLCARH